MRTIVNTTKRTTYVVTDHDIIEALASLGIPRSVLLSEDTTFKACENVSAEEGFDFCGAGDATTSTFLTVEAPAEESEESEASVDPAPAPTPDRFPVGTILRSKYGDDYFIVGHVSPPERYAEGYYMWPLRDVPGDTTWDTHENTNNPKKYTVVHRPTPGVLTPGEGAPADPFPVGTVLRYNLGSEFVSCVTGHVKDGDPDKGPGYTTSSVLYKTGWETYDSAHRNYTVLYRPPSKA